MSGLKCCNFPVACDPPSCRSILFPREHEQSFVSDSLKFIIFMLVGCMALFMWAAVVLYKVRKGGGGGAHVHAVALTK